MNIQDTLCIYIVLKYIRRQDKYYYNLLSYPNNYFIKHNNTKTLLLRSLVGNQQRMKQFNML